LTWIKGIQEKENPLQLPAVGLSKSTMDIQAARLPHLLQVKADLPKLSCRSGRADTAGQSRL